ncbi:MAG: hypothetical protein P8Z77_01025 [Candidatus Thiodiazotropha sp.]
MNRTRRQSIKPRFTLPLLISLATTQAVAAMQNLEAQPVDFDSENWQSNKAKLAIRLKGAQASVSGRPAFLVGRQDLTSLFKATTDGIYRYSNERLPLPSGERDLRVYWVDDNNQWKLLGKWQLRILTPGGFEQASWTPRAELSGQAQLDESFAGDAQGSPRGDHYEDANYQLGLESEHRRGDLTINGRVNLTGVSNRSQALRFGEKQEEAPKLDLSDYRIGIAKGNSTLAQGHVNFGAQPLLLDNLASRGLTYQHQFGRAVRFGFTAQHAQRIVGYNQLAGFNDADNRIMAASLGVELIPSRPGALFTELLYLSGKRRNAVSFDVGEVADTESNSGYGLRIGGQSEDGRLQGALDYARSRFDNPNDPIISNGQGIVEVTETTDDAYALDLNYRLLEGDPASNWPMTLSIGYRTQHVDPLYRSMTAFVTADRKSENLRLQGQIGQISMQWEGVRSEDNLDDIPSILKTRTEESRFNLTVPLAAIHSNGSNQLWPQNMSYAQMRVHQFGINQAFNDPSQIPDQYSVSHQLGFNWAFTDWNLDYNFNYAIQDNRQSGREEADFVNRGHNLNIGLRVTESLLLNFGIGHTEASDQEADLDRFSNSYNFDVDWQVDTSWSLSGNFGITRDDDSQDNEESESNQAQMQLGYRFELPGPAGGRLPGQVYLRANYAETQSINAAFGLDSEGVNRSIHAGMSLSLF